jgi:hypothetical protein
LQSSDSLDFMNHYKIVIGKPSMAPRALFKILLCLNCKKAL